MARRWVAVAALMGAAACGDGPTEGTPSPTEVRVSPGTATLLPLETQQLQATALDAAGNPVAGSSPVWRSRDEERATVTASGLVTAIRPGVVTIEATMNGLTGSASITVGTPPGVPGRIVVPSGVDLDPTTLTVVSEQGEVPVGPLGDFHLELLPGARSQVDVVSANGDLVMFGVVDGTGAAIEVSATATAEALLYYALGGFALPAEVQDRFVELVHASSAVSGLASTFAARMAADPAVLVGDDAALADAVEAARTAILGGPAGTAIRTALSVSGGPRPVTGAAGYANVTVQPSGPQSGVELLLDTGAGGVLAQNAFRRPAALVVYRTGTVADDGTVTDEFPPVQVGDVVQVPATGRLGNLNALTDIITGGAPFAPERTPPIPLPPEPGAASTLYTAVLLGPTLDFVSSPPIFQDSRFFGFSDEWNTILDEKRLELFWDAFAAPALESFAFGRVGLIPVNRKKAFVDGVRDLADSRLAGLGLLLRADGGYANAMKFLIDEMKDGVFRLEFMDVLTEALDASDQQKIDRAKVEKRLSGRASAGAVLAAVTLALASGDLAAVLAHLQSSSEGESWDLEVTLPPIRVEPQSPQVTTQQRSVDFVATVDGHPGGDFRFTWTSTTAHGSLFVEGGGDHNDGSTGRAQYVATSAVLPPGTVDRVTVEVTALNEDTGQRESLGSRTLDIQGPETNYQVTIDPQLAVVRAAEATDLRASLSPAYQGSGLFFRWNTTGFYGTIFPAHGTLTGFDVVTYTANVGAEGTDEITVEVYDEFDNLLGTASAQVSVQPPDPVTVQGAYVFDQEFYTDSAGNPRVCAAAYITFPLEVNATRYEMHAYGFNDWTGFWGTEIRRNFSPPFAAGDPSPCAFRAGAVGDTYLFFLSGGSGPASGAGDQVTYFNSRFSGMTVDVTIIH